MIIVFQFTVIFINVNDRYEKDNGRRKKACIHSTDFPRAYYV